MAAVGKISVAEISAESSEMEEEEVNTSPNNDRYRMEWKAHRSRNGVSLEQIADTTKISIRFLRAIENEDFHVLPGGIFGKSYVRQYAEAAGCDADLLMERYRAHCAEPEKEDALPAPHRPSGRGQERTAPPHWLRAFGSIKS